jgi:hypothetical protein
MLIRAAISALFVLGDIGMPLAQNSFPTPGGATVPGYVNMCITGNLAVPCNPSGGGGGGLLLDSVTATATAAYSTRKLRSAYAGAAMRVINTTTTSQADIGFTGNDLNTAALATACSGATCRIVEWYDQSGAGNNTGLDSTTVAAVVNAGVNYTLNGHVAVRTLGAGAGDCLGVTMAIAPPTTFGVVANITSYVTNSALTSGTSGGFEMTMGPTATSWQLYNTGTALNGGTYTTGTSYGVIAVVDGVNSTLIASGVVKIPTGMSPGTASSASQLVGGANGPACFDGYMPEFIIFNSNLSGADRSAMAANWTAYWGT